MMLRILAAVFLVWTLVSASAQGQESAKASVRGVVRRTGTEEPIAGVLVTLSRITSPTQPMATTITDEKGRFVLAGIDPTAYRLSVGKNGYVKHDSQSSITPRAGQTIDGIVVHLKQTATISGQVRSAAGKPLAGVTVKLLRRSYDTEGSPSFSRAFTVETNDLGEYRGYWITPGRYFLSAGSLYIPGTAPRDRWDFYPEMFFSGVTDISQAEVIDLQEGADLRTLDFTLRRLERFYSIRGRVIDAATGQAPARATVFIGFGGRETPYDPATGTFELPYMAPGRYSLGARLGGSNEAGAPWVYTAAPQITVVGANIENLVLTQAPLSIEGQIRVEGQWPSAMPMGKLGVSLVPVVASPIDPFNFRVPPAEVGHPEADGAFRITINAAREAEFRLKLSGLPGTLYVKDARLGGMDVLHRPSRLPTSGRLDILISGSGGGLSGRVLNDKMEPVSSAEVVLVPNEPRDRPELFKRATTVDGQFRIDGIAPGNYKVFAWERVEGNAFFDPEVLRRFEARGTPVRIRELSLETMDVRLIPEAVF